MKTDGLDIDSDEFYISVLLVCGPDPEPNLRYPSSIWRIWLDDVEEYASTLDRTDLIFGNWFGGYYRWLGQHELGYLEKLR